jgi:transposase
MTEEKRKKYDVFFKEEAVKLIVERGRTPGTVAKELGINATMLGRWKREYLSGKGFPGKGHIPKIDEENHLLRKELADVKMERDILKKAVGIFSKGPR